jgi:hypothetical protein
MPRNQTESGCHRNCRLSNATTLLSLLSNPIPCLSTALNAQCNSAQTQYKPAALIGQLNPAAAGPHRAATWALFPPSLLPAGGHPVHLVSSDSRRCLLLSLTVSSYIFISEAANSTSKPAIGHAPPPGLWLVAGGLLQLRNFKAEARRM